jgi:hypothetical protein
MFQVFTTAPITNAMTKQLKIANKFGCIVFFFLLLGPMGEKAIAQKDTEALSSDRSANEEIEIKGAENSLPSDVVYFIHQYFNLLSEVSEKISGYSDSDDSIKNDVNVSIAKNRIEFSEFFLNPVSRICAETKIARGLELTPNEYFDQFVDFFKEHRISQGSKPGTSFYGNSIQVFAPVRHKNTNLYQISYNLDVTYDDSNTIREKRYLTIAYSNSYGLWKSNPVIIKITTEKQPLQSVYLSDMEVSGGPSFLFNSKSSLISESITRYHFSIVPNFKFYSHNYTMLYISTGVQYQSLGYRNNIDQYSTSFPSDSNLTSLIDLQGLKLNQSLDYIGVPLKIGYRHYTKKMSWIEGYFGIGLGFLSQAKVSDVNGNVTYKGSFSFDGSDTPVIVEDDDELGYGKYRAVAAKGNQFKKFIPTGQIGMRFGLPINNQFGLFFGSNLDINLIGSKQPGAGDRGQLMPFVTLDGSKAKLASFTGLLGISYNFSHAWLPFASAKDYNSKERSPVFVKSEESKEKSISLHLPADSSLARVDYFIQDTVSPFSIYKQGRLNKSDKPKGFTLPVSGNFLVIPKPLNYDLNFQISGKDYQARLKDYTHYIVPLKEIGEGLTINPTLLPPTIVFLVLLSNKDYDFTANRTTVQEGIKKIALAKLEEFKKDKSSTDFVYLKANVPESVDAQGNTIQIFQSCNSKQPDFLQVIESWLMDLKSVGLPTGKAGVNTNNQLTLPSCSIRVRELDIFFFANYNDLLGEGIEGLQEVLKNPGLKENWEKIHINLITNQTDLEAKTLLEKNWTTHVFDKWWEIKR